MKWGWGCFQGKVFNGSWHDSCLSHQHSWAIRRDEYSHAYVWMSMFHVNLTFQGGKMAGEQEEEFCNWTRLGKAWSKELSCLHEVYLLLASSDGWSALIYADQRIHHHPPLIFTSYPSGNANPGPAKHPTTSTNGQMFDPLTINISDSHRHM